MAEINTFISGELTIKKIIGEVTADELMNALRQFYTGHITKNVVWDLTNGSAGKLMPINIEHIAELVLQHAHVRIGGKAAIVAPNDLNYGMSRMFNTYAELGSIPFETQIFRTLSEAGLWMGVDALSAIEGTGGRESPSGTSSELPQTQE